MFKINDKEITNIKCKDLSIIKCTENGKDGYSLYLIVKFFLNNKEGYFTLDFGFENKNNVNLFLNKEYKGNLFSNNKKIVFEIFDTENYFDSEITSHLDIKFYQKENKLFIKIILNDKLLKLEFEQDVRFINDDISRYFDNDFNNPKYLFHGSPKLLDKLEPRQAFDSNGNIDNIDNAVFMTPSLILASAYAFKDTIKQLSYDLDWNFEIGQDPKTKEIFVIMENINIDDDIEGYIYVSNFDVTVQHEEGSIQYKLHKDVIPLEIIKIRFKDFKKYYTINKKEKEIN